MKFALRRLKNVLFGFVAKLCALFTKFSGFFTKQRRVMRLIFAISTVIILCIILSGGMLIQLSSDYQPSNMNGGDDPDQSETGSPASQPISNVGSLKTTQIAAYWDELLTNRVNFINWGALEPGAQSNVVLYLSNEGTLNVTLSEYASNWNPSVASNYLTLSWDYNGQTIKPGENLQVTFTLSVSANVVDVTSFNFDITVEGDS